MEQNSEQKNFSFYYILGLLLVMIFLHFVANATYVYQTQIQNGSVWFDNILHTIAGMAFTLLVLWILNRNNLQYSLTTTIIFTIACVFCLATLWELIEFGFFKIFTSYAQNLNIYSPSIKEAFSDILSNVFGGIIILPFTMKWYKSK